MLHFYIKNFSSHFKFKIEKVTGFLFCEILERRVLFFLTNDMLYGGVGDTFPHLAYQENV
jgi:hypothetical protein